MYCKYCGKELESGSKYCNDCGSPVEPIYNHETKVNYQKGVVAAVEEEHPNRDSKKHIKGQVCSTVILTLVIAFFVALFTICILNSSDGKSEESNSEKVSQTISSEEQFKSIGLNDAEAKEFAEIFNELGLKEIRDIEFGPGDGSVDGLQSCRCKLYDYKSLQINFTIENRQLCYVDVSGLPSTKSEFYISMFGNLKVKQVNSTSSVVMYDIWDDDENVDYSKDWYLAVFDYENRKISEYNK